MTTKMQIVFYDPDEDVQIVEADYIEIGQHDIHLFVGNLLVFWATKRKVKYVRVLKED